jgi:uncharacterized membrane protein YcaP (DUF421 family)
MMESETSDFIHRLLFYPGKDLQFFEMLIRAVIVFITTLFIVRIGKKKFLGKNTAFDVVLGVTVGSIVARAINGTGEFVSTMAAALLLIGLHWVITLFTSKNDKLGDIIEGVPHALIEHGKLNEHNLRRTHFREIDIIEAARLRANTGNLNDIQEAHIEA